MDSRYGKQDDELEMYSSRSGTRPELPGISGLGGWLILIQISLWASLVFLFSDISQVTVIMDPARWEGSRGVDPQLYAEVIRPLLWFGFISSVILFVIVVVNLVLLYRRKRLFPRLMIVQYIVNVIIGVVTWILIAQNEVGREEHVLDATPAFHLIVRSLLTCCIFIPYFLKSVRVKNTFIK
ncbi:DUF2569 domain-containing protein [Paenibacillus sp. 2TAF8]|jgi:hypothetical protein|uniref:DUF2569 domain-containing protein n=1 Tax=Paenibacillus sp. 2TAF8 TaxID=3233020 RepID=UPI003F9A0BBC